MGATSKFLIILFLFFSAGIAVWKLGRGGLHPQEIDANQQAVSDGRAAAGSIVEIDGEAVTRSDVEFEYQLHTIGTTGDEDLTPMPKSDPQNQRDISTLKEELLSTIVERKVLFKYIQQDKSYSSFISENQPRCAAEWKTTLETGIKLFETQENQGRLKSRICETSTLNKFLREVIYKDLAVKDEEVIEYFRNHQHEYHGPERIAVRQIVVARDSEAQTLHRKLNKQNFAELAREHSIMPEAKNGGAIGPFAKGQLPPVFDIAFTLKVGDISPIQKSSYGHHIMMVTRKFTKDQLELDEVKDKIRIQILENKQKEEYKKWVELAIHSVHVDTTKPIW